MCSGTLRGPSFAPQQEGGKWQQAPTLVRSVMGQLSRDTHRWMPHPERNATTGEDSSLRKGLCCHLVDPRGTVLTWAIPLGGVQVPVGQRVLLGFKGCPFFAHLY